MHLRPKNLEELKSSLEEANRAHWRIDSVDLSALSKLVQHQPEDMTATVEGGMTLGALQAQLQERGQWLPLDPPHPESLTISQLISSNASGPRRFGYGTARDYLLEIKVAFADGRIVKSGGKVVKNVAGYDLAKLFVGSRDTLGVVVEATFKLKPLAATEQFVQKRLHSLDDLEPLLETILNSELVPTVLDMHNTAAIGSAKGIPSHLVMGFAGEREEVDDQFEHAKALMISEPASLDYDRQFWATESALPLKSASVLPSELVKTIRSLGDTPFLARAGNGLLWYRGGPEIPRSPLPLQLMHRVKDTFDPNHIFPELRL